MGCAASTLDQPPPTVAPTKVATSPTDAAAAAAGDRDTAVAVVKSASTNGNVTVEMKPPTETVTVTSATSDEDDQPRKPPLAPRPSVTTAAAVADSTLTTAPPASSSHSSNYLLTEVNPSRSHLTTASTSLTELDPNAIPFPMPTPSPTSKSAERGSSNSTPPTKPTSWTAASVISTGLLYLSTAAEMCPIAGADTVAATLKSIYSLFNSATTKEEWLAEFMVYLRDVEIEMCSASLIFQRQNYCQQLTRQLVKSKRVIEKITKRNRFIAIATADSDRLALENERSELEKIKSSSLMSMLTEMNSDTLAVKEEIQQIKTDLNSSQEFTKSIQVRKEEFEKNERLLGRLQPIPFESEIESQYINYLPNTRLSIIDTVGEWIQFSHSPSSPSSPIPPSRLFFLSGGPGSGKSCLSSVICNRYREDVVAVHFCLHDREITREARRMVRSIAYQLAKRIPEYAGALHETIPAVFGGDLNSSTTSNDASTTAADLWKRLIVDPLFPIKNEILKQRQSIGRKYIILIDALDEGAIGSDASKGNDLLDILSSSIKELPIWLNVLVTSRPEVAIVKKLQKYEPVELKCESAENLHDLRIYFHHFLEPAIYSTELESAVDLLVTKSGGLMLCARLMLHSHGLFPNDLPEEWSGRDYAKQPLTLDELRLWPTGLGDFYLTALNRIRTKIEHNKNVKLVEYANQQVPTDLVQMIKIVSFILGAYEPLTLQTLSEMCQLPDFETVLRLLTPLRTLFPIIPPNDSPSPSPSPSPTHSTTTLIPTLTGNATVSVYHKSVYDWFLSPERKLDDEQLIYYCDYAAIHRTMAECCFERLISKQSLPSESELAESPFSSMLTRHRQQLSALPSSTPLLPSPPSLCSVEVTHLIHPDGEVVPPVEDMPLLHGKFIHPAHPQHSLIGTCRESQIPCLVCQKCTDQDLTLCLTCATEAETQLLRAHGIGQIQLDLMEHPPPVVVNDDHAKSKTKKKTHPTHTSTGSKSSQPKHRGKSSSIEKHHPQPESKVVEPSTHVSHGSRKITGRPWIHPPAAESKSPGQLEIEQFQANALKAKCGIAICDDCMKEPYERFEDENQKRVDLFNANRPLSTLELNSFLSYAIRRGSSHALDSGSLAHVTGFLCHLQYWYIAILTPGDASTMISRIQQAISQQWTLVPPPASNQLSPIYWPIPADLWGEAATRAPLITTRLQDCLIQHMRFYQLQSHHFMIDLARIFQDGLMMPTSSLVCQQAFLLLPNLIPNTALLPSVGLLDAPNKPQELSNLLQVIATPTSLRQLIMTQDSRLMVTRNGSETFVWDALTGEMKKVLYNPGTVLQVTLSPDETRVATIALDNEMMHYRVFNIENVEILWEVDYKIPIIPTTSFQLPLANWIPDDEGRIGYQFIIGQNNDRLPILSFVNGPSKYLEDVELEYVNELVFERSEVVMMEMSPSLDTCIVCLDWSVKLVASRQRRLVCIYQYDLPGGPQEPRSLDGLTDGTNFHHLLFLDNNRVFITMAQPDYPIPNAIVLVLRIDSKGVKPLSLIHLEPTLKRVDDVQYEYTPCIAAIDHNRLNDTLIMSLVRGDGGSSIIEIWHGQTFEVLQTVALNDWGPRSLHTNGYRFVMVSGQTQSAFEYDLPTCQLLGQHGEELNHSQYVQIKQSNDELKERLLTTNVDGRIRLWEPKLKTQISPARDDPLPDDVTYITEHHLSSCGRYSLQVDGHDLTIKVWDWTNESPSSSSNAQPAGVGFLVGAEQSQHSIFIPSVNCQMRSHNPPSIMIQTILTPDGSHSAEASVLPGMTPTTSKDLRSICEPSDPFDETERDIDVLPCTASLVVDESIWLFFQQPCSIHQLSVARMANKARQQILDKLHEKNIFTYQQSQPLVCFGCGDAADLLFLGDTRPSDSRGLFIYSWKTGQLLYHQSFIEPIQSIYFDGAYQQLWIQSSAGSASPLFYQALHLKRTNATTTSSSNLTTNNTSTVSSLSSTCDLVVTPIGVICSMAREKDSPMAICPFGRCCFILIGLGHKIDCRDIRTNESLWIIALPNTIKEPVRIHPNLTHLMVLEKSGETILVIHLAPWMKDRAINQTTHALSLSNSENGSRPLQHLSITSSNDQPYPVRSPSIQPPVRREYSFSPPAVHTHPPRFLHLHCID